PRVAAPGSGSPHDRIDGAGQARAGALHNRARNEPTTCRRTRPRYAKNLGRSEGPVGSSSADLVGSSSADLVQDADRRPPAVRHHLRRFRRVSALNHVARDPARPLTRPLAVTSLRIVVRGMVPESLHRRPTPSSHNPAHFCTRSWPSSSSARPTARATPSELRCSSKCAPHGALKPPRSLPPTSSIL